MNQKEWKADEIRENILKSDVWLNKAILAIFKKQTLSEQSSESTHLLNSVGFSAFDAKKMSYYAKWLLSGRALTGHHRDNARKKILRYTKQLTKIANKEA